MGWFLYDKGLRHERVNCYYDTFSQQPTDLITFTEKSLIENFIFLQCLRASNNKYQNQKRTQSSQISKIKRYAQIANGWKPSTAFAKKLHLRYFPEFWIRLWSCFSFLLKQDIWKSWYILRLRIARWLNTIKYYMQTEDMFNVIKEARVWL